MRVLLLMRGAPGCGKSYRIERQGLKPYSLCPDELRLLCGSPSLTVSGGESIDTANENAVWKTLLDLLEQRMKNGDLTVIDATNSKTAEMRKYLDLCEKYKYRAYCVDFTDVAIETAKEQNRRRSGIKRVPDRVIDRMYSRFASEKVPSKITVIKPNELEKIWLKKIDLSKYKRIHHIGDIHGCYSALKEYFDRNGGIHDDEYYIFTGDYCDRGIENSETLNFLLSVYELPNFCLLEGNHEKYLWHWANGEESPSKMFDLTTKVELENAGIDKKAVRKLYRRLRQCAYYEYFGSTYFVCHGGLSKLPDCVTKIPTRQLIEGVGNFNDVETVARSFTKNTPDNVYQIFGHRNPKFLPMQLSERVFDLDCGIEFGGNLRALQVEPGGVHTEAEIKNNVFAKKRPAAAKQSQTSETVGEAIEKLRKNRYIIEKQFGSISSFNFTDSAFIGKVWNSQTEKARGLYVNIPKQKIVARAYDKFFNINERPETQLDSLRDSLSFPVNAYVKENGFLGIASYNEETDSLFITTKSNPEGKFAELLRNIMKEKVSGESLEAMKELSRDNGVSFVFECIDIKNDTHIIEYPENRLYLLDVIYNGLTFKKFGYEKLCETANRLGITPKEKAFTFDSWAEFYRWYLCVTKDDYLYNGGNIEGFVLEDQNGTMVKLKLSYYNFWKQMRAMALSLKKGEITDSSALSSLLAKEFYAWISSSYENGSHKSLPEDICSLRRMFFEHFTVS